MENCFVNLRFSKTCGVTAFEVFQFLSIFVAKVTAELPSLMDLFVNIKKTFSVQIKEMIKNQVTKWIISQVGLIQGMFINLCWKS